jgi:hypothetical protein
MGPLRMLKERGLRRYSIGLGCVKRFNTTTKSRFEILSEWQKTWKFVPDRDSLWKLLIIILIVVNIFFACPSSNEALRQWKLRQK